MHEAIPVSFVRCDKAESLAVIEPLNGPLGYVPTPLIRIEGVGPLHLTSIKGPNIGETVDILNVLVKYWPVSISSSSGALPSEVG